MLIDARMDTLHTTELAKWLGFEKEIDERQVGSILLSSSLLE